VNLDHRRIGHAETFARSCLPSSNFAPAF
jgi:hypothetical protein